MEILKKWLAQKPGNLTSSLFLLFLFIKVKKLAVGGRLCLIKKDYLITGGIQINSV
jgi:hypothetical protein